MKDSLNHALVMTTLLERDIARICASGNSAQQGLAADCAEHRRQLANKLRHIQSLTEKEAPGSFAAYVDHHAAKFIPSTPEQSAELHKLQEQAFRKSRERERKGEFSAELLDKELKEAREQSFKAGDFNDDDINPISDKAYQADLVRKANVEMWRNYDRKKNWLGCGLACIAAGVILGGIKIWFAYF